MKFIFPFKYNDSDKYKSHEGGLTFLSGSNFSLEKKYTTSSQFQFEYKPYLLAAKKHGGSSRLMQKQRILLVNPWIHDFAAFNLWARPLGLLHVAGFLSGFEVELLYIDCLDRFVRNEFGCGKYFSQKIEKPPRLRNVPRHYKRYGISVDEFSSRLKNLMPFNIVLVTSIMSYWYPGVQETLKRIRETAGNVPIILGGIYPTLYREHAARYSGADTVYSGPLDLRLLSLLGDFDVRVHASRQPVPYPELRFYPDQPFVPLLTSTGCPYRCTYCASGLLHSGYARRPVDDVFNEIYGFAKRGITDFVFYDDALLFDADHHLKPLLENIVRKHIDVRFHAPNGMHARFIDDELALLMRAAGFRTIRLSLETIDPVRQQQTGAKVVIADLEKAVKLLHSKGFTKKELGAYLMYGLPGQTLGEVQEGINFLKKLDVTVHLSEFSPIKGTPAWDHLVNKGIIEDSLDPIFTNNTVFSCLYAHYDLSALEKMKIAVREYNNP